MQVQQDSAKFHILVIGIVIEITVYPFRAYVYFASVPAQMQNTILIFNRPSTKVIKKTPF